MVQSTSGDTPDRRRWSAAFRLASCLVALFAWAILSRMAEARELPCPIDLDIGKLEAGDLIWPRKAIAMIPYGTGGESAERQLWERGKADFLASLEGQRLSDAEARDKLRISQMQFRQFQAQYLEGPGLTPRGVGRVVGHVAIVDIKSPGRIEIIEALPGHGVIATPLTEWAATVCDDVFWQGRVLGAPLAMRRSIATQARRFLGARYDIFNRKLDDASSFYCSKLAWLAIREATGISADDNPEPRRWNWFSPRQLIESRHIELKQNPGDYRGPILNPKGR